MPPKFFSLFTGGDGAGWGARAAGYHVCGGVEFRADIAAVAADNDPGARFIVGDVRSQDYAAIGAAFGGIGHLHASPSCKKASIANADRGETPEDRETAQAVCRAIREMHPVTFTLENVRGYMAFDAYRAILDTLTAEGYGYAAGVLNAASYGVPQTRERLIVVAVRGLPSWAVSLPPPTHARRRDAGAQLSLFDAPAMPPWVGWYEALLDLLPTLPPSQFAPWQMARLPAEVRESVLVNGDNASRDLTTRDAYDPMWTLQAAVAKAPPRAFLLDGTPNPDGVATARDGEARGFTVTAGSGAKRAARAWLVTNAQGGERDGERTATATPDDMPTPTVSTQAGGRTRAWLAAGRVVQLTPRALARLQSFPDAYRLPAKAGLACEVIGNAVPPLLAQRIMEHVASLVARVPAEVRHVS